MMIEPTQPIHPAQEFQQQDEVPLVQQPIETAIQRIERLNTQMIEVLEANERNRQLIPGIREARALQFSYYISSGVVLSGTALASLISPLVVGNIIRSPLFNFYLNHLYQYLMANSNQPGWAQDIIEAIQRENARDVKPFFFSKIKLICQTSSIFKKNFDFELRLPASVITGIPASAFGLIVAGSILGIGGGALLIKLGWREMPVSFREFLSLFTHVPKLLDYQEDHQNGEGQEDVEMQNDVEQVEIRRVDQAIIQGERIVSEQLKALAYNFIYTICWPVIALAIWGIYRLGVDRSNHLQNINLADFDARVKIPSSCGPNATINLVYFDGIDYPIPGAVEFLRQQPPRYMSDDFIEQIKNSLTVTAMVFAILPLIPSLIVPLVLGIIRCSRRPQPLEEIEAPVQPAEPIVLIQDEEHQQNEEHQADPEVGCATVMEPIYRPENETDSDSSSSSSSSSSDEELPWGQQFPLEERMPSNTI